MCIYTNRPINENRKLAIGPLKKKITYGVVFGSQHDKYKIKVPKNQSLSIIQI